jgi:hypothetical protein
LRAVGSWLAAHPVDVLFGALVAGAFAYLLRMSRGGFFTYDDWRLAGRSIREMFEPYNDCG